MRTLIIRHVASSEPAQFQVVRQRDGKNTDPRIVVSAFGFPVEGQPDSDSVRELGWYLERFLDYPYPPGTDHAERVLDSLSSWGRQAFNALFGDRERGRFFEEAARKGYERLHLVISSDNARVLSWPWEALRDPESGVLALTCQNRAPLEPYPRFPADFRQASDRSGQRPSCDGTALRRRRAFPVHVPPVGRADRKGNAADAGACLAAADLRPIKRTFAGAASFLKAVMSPIQGLARHLSKR